MQSVTSLLVKRHITLNSVIFDKTMRKNEQW